MADQVMPLPEGARPRLGTLNGCGTRMLGFTRTDDTGRCFTTRWFTMFGLPLIPLERYYCTQGETSYAVMGVTTAYQIFGVAARLRAFEIIRTYLYCWVFAPTFVVGPILLLLNSADGVVRSLPGGIGTFIALFCVALVGLVVALNGIQAYYRDHWAPLRQVEWTQIKTVIHPGSDGGPDAWNQGPSRPTR